MPVDGSSFIYWPNYGILGSLSQGLSGGKTITSKSKFIWQIHALWQDTVIGKVLRSGQCFNIPQIILFKQATFTLVHRTSFGS